MPAHSNDISHICLTFHQPWGAHIGTVTGKRESAKLLESYVICYKPDFFGTLVVSSLPFLVPLYHQLKWGVIFELHIQDVSRWNVEGSNHRGKFLFSKHLLDFIISVLNAIFSTERTHKTALSLPFRVLAVVRRMLDKWCVFDPNKPSSFCRIIYPVLRIIATIILKLSPKYPLQKLAK